MKFPKSLMIFALVFSALLVNESVLAHKSSETYLTIDLAEPVMIGRWDIALRDLHFNLGIDSNNDGKIHWAELKNILPNIHKYIFASIRAVSPGKDCTLTPTGNLIEKYADGAYLVVRFDSDCNSNDVTTIAYNLFFDTDAFHRGFIRVVGQEGETVYLASPEHNTIELSENNDQALLQFWRFLSDGVWHIWRGYDHIIFLIALLIPSVLSYRSGIWQGQDNFKGVLVDVAWVVTAFSVAHSITLMIASMEWVSLPSRLVESTIAVTIIIAGLHNLMPVFKVKRTHIAFVLGLVHGFGFASVLSGLNMSGGSYMLSLFGFNLGVEVGQIIIVAMVIPVLYFFRNSQHYQTVSLRAGSVCISMFGSVWLVQRLFV